MGEKKTKGNTSQTRQGNEMNRTSIHYKSVMRSDGRETGFGNVLSAISSAFSASAGRPKGGRGDYHPNKVQQKKAQTHILFTPWGHSYPLATLTSDFLTIFFLYSVCNVIRCILFHHFTIS